MRELVDYRTVHGIDKSVSRIVFGADRLGYRERPRLYNRSLEQQALSLLDRSFELGYNTFDTARIYLDSERMLGAWMRQRRNRDEVVIISKGCHPHPLQKTPRLSPSDVTHDLHASLKALRTDFIDLYLLHFDHPTASAEPIMERLSRHIDEGKISAIGVSNWSHNRIARANTAAAGNGGTPFSASSVQFSLADWTRPPFPGGVSLGGDGQRAAREWYSTQGLSVFAYASLAQGFFSDHYDPKIPDHNPISRWCSTYFGTEENIQRLERAKALADEQHVTVAQVALAYVLCHPLHAFAVVSCTTVEKLAQNVAALSLELDEATLHWLDTGRASR